MDPKLSTIDDILKTFLVDQAASPETAATRFHPASTPLIQRFKSGSEKIEDRRGQPALSELEQLINLMQTAEAEFDPSTTHDRSPVEYPHAPYFPIKHPVRKY